MSSMGMKERLRELLRSVPGATEVVVEREGRKLIALVVSTDFEGIEHHLRQERIWRMILDSFSDHEQAEVGYVFTDTPEENAHAQVASAPGG
jgi:acid stress-induced BolA-like protein IbaG/YrbA